MRIAILMSLASLWSREIALRLSKLGHSVHVIDFAENNPEGQYLPTEISLRDREIVAFSEQISGVHLLPRRFKSGLKYIASVGDLKKILSDSRAEILLTLYGGGYAIMAYLSGFRPYAIYAVGSDVMLVKGLRRRLTRTAFRAASAVFSNGRYLGKKTQELSPEATVVPLYIGIDGSKFSPVSVPESPIRIVCSRGFLPVYNNEYLIEGLARLSEAAPDFDVTFVSSGPTLDDVRTLADRVLPPAVRQRVHFLGGVHSDAFLEHVRNAHIFVSLSRSDGTSTAVLEALACGLFPILSDIPQNREWIEGGAQNGLLVPLDQPEALAQALERAMTDKELRLRASVYNRDLVLDRADSSRTMADMAQQLEAIVQFHQRKVL